MNAMVLSRAPRRAFTLVELLVVIIIIGMLAAMATRAALQAVTRAKNTAITLELQNIGNALEANLDKFGGSYPTNFGQTDATTRENRLMSQLRRMFPRATFSNYDDLADFIQNLYGITPLGVANDYHLDNMDQAEAIVFWLGGMPMAAGSGSTKLNGFSANVQNPFQLTGSRLPKLFEFDETRLVDTDSDGWLEYIPDVDVDTSPAPPYVYFDGATLTSTPASFGFYNSGVYGATWGIASPYFTGTVSVSTPVNPKKFQIVAAGLDGMYGDAGTARTYGTMPLFPAGNNYHQADMDNLTNFSDGTLQAAQEAD